MGGVGSGGSRYGGRSTTESSCELSLAFLRDYGALNAGSGSSGTSRWTSRGRQVASIGWRTEMRDVPQLTLHYTYTPEGGTPQQVSESFPLSPTPLHFGGVRWWMRCRCGRRVAKIYKPGFAHLFRCRHCYRVPFASQNETAEWRAYRRAQKLVARIDAKFAKNLVPADYLDGYYPPPKPKGMRWRTYERLVQDAGTHATKYRRMAGMTLGRILARQPPR